MSKRQKLIRPLMGQFLGWGDDRIPHRYVKLATANGEQLIKVARSLRPQLQDWQPGSWLTVMIQERIDRSTGEKEIKVKQLLTPPRVLPLDNYESELGSRPILDYSSLTSSLVTPTKIKVCQGSTCRRQGSDKICQAMQTYLDRNNLTERVEIESVKCLHQCKAAPHAIFTSSAGEKSPKKVHYRQIQTYQIQAILARHFPIVSLPQSIVASLLETIGTYLQKNQIFTSITH
jgi:hypothetical protein